MFLELFNEIVLQCVKSGVVSGETGVADGSFLPSNVSLNSRYEAAAEIKPSTIKYMEKLELELSFLPGYVESETIELESKSLKSYTDSDCGYIHLELKKD